MSLSAEMYFYSRSKNLFIDLTWVCLKQRAQKPQSQKLCVPFFPRKPYSTKTRECMRLFSRGKKTAMAPVTDLLMDSQCWVSTGVFIPFNKGAFLFLLDVWWWWWWGGWVNGWPISISGGFCVGKSSESNCRKTSWGIVHTLRWRKRDAEVVVVYSFFFSLSPFLSLGKM